MSRTLLAAALALALGPAGAAPKDEVVQTLERWTRAFTASDAETIASLYAPDATFFGTGSQALVTRHDDVHEYFASGLMKNRPRGAALGEHAVVMLSDTVAVVTGLDTVTATREGQTVAAPGRVSFVLQKRDARWQIVHFHRSALPR